MALLRLQERAPARAAVRAPRPEGRRRGRDRRPAARPRSTPSCACGSRTCSEPASTASSSTTTSSSLSESDPARIHFTIHVAGDDIPTSPCPSSSTRSSPLARTWDDRLRERARRRRTARSAARELADAATRERFPDYYKNVDRHLDWRRSTSSSSSGSATGAPSSSRSRTSAAARRPDAGRHLQDRRQGAAVRVAADPREPRPDGRRGGADAPERRRRRDVPARLRRPRTRRPACST